MDEQKIRIIDERVKTEPIPIKIKKSESFSEIYNLKNDSIDPAQSSPPNIFLLKLHNRMNMYDIPNYKT